MCKVLAEFAPSFEEEAVVIKESLGFGSTRTEDSINSLPRAVAIATTGKAEEDFAM
jgi:hypothetical protein